jgi:hypothetical protein
MTIHPLASVRWEGDVFGEMVLTFLPPKKLSSSKKYSKFDLFNLNWFLIECQFSGNNFLIRQFLGTAQTRIVTACVNSRWGENTDGSHGKTPHFLILIFGVGMGGVLMC